MVREIATDLDKCSAATSIVLQIVALKAGMRAVILIVKSLKSLKSVKRVKPAGKEFKMLPRFSVGLQLHEGP